MKAALLIVLSLSALAFAGPAFNKNNQIETSKAQQQQQQQQYMTAGQNNEQQTKTIETLKQWCFSSQMSQPELTSSFKKLVGIVKSSPSDQWTESAVMNERVCQGALVQKSAQNGETVAQNEADASAHELIKDVYMDALIACESSECMQQLVKIINSNKVDTIRASYYMTRLAVSEKDSIKDESDIKEFAEQYIHGQQQSRSESVERQKLFAVTSLVGKTLSEKSQDYNTNKQQKSATTELEQTAEQLAKTIVDRYIKSVSEQEVQQYQQQSQQQQQSSALSKKIAKRSAALKALANLPGWVLSEEVEQTLIQLAQNKQELSTVRQSAIECLEQNEEATKTLKKITFDQEEPIEVRVAAYRALMTVTFAGDNNKSEQAKHQQASEIVDQVVRHCEEQRNQQQDDQFVLYAISHLDNLRSSQQPEHKAIKDCIAKNKQHYMQIQLLNKKFKSQLNDVRKSSRNYKLEQEFNQIESGLVIEGDLIYESKHHQNQYNQKQQQQQKQWTGPQVLPKLVRVNMSMPVMGETVNVVEITLRQNDMDEELLGALKLVQGAKFNSESMSKVVDSFKSSIEQQQQRQQGQQQESAEADLSIKVDGCTIVYLSVDDFKSSHQQQQGQRRNTRSTSSGSIVDEIIEYLKRQPVAFNRGFNFNVNERLAKVLDVEANIIAGLRFESRASGKSSEDFEIVAQVEPRFGFEAIVGPAKMSSKKLLQRVSTKTALGLRLRYKSDELVDVQVDLPMNTMELFTIETQMVEKKSSQQQGEQDSYSYLPESIYGSSDIYSPDEEYSRQWLNQQDSQDQYQSGSFKGIRKMIKRSIFESNKKSSSVTKSIVKLMSGKQSTFAESFETPEEIARATGLRAKVRVVASPKDMSFLIQAVAQKCDQNMQGYRVQLQKSPRSDKLSQQYTVAFSTPGSRVDRNMQIRVIKQQTQQRTLIKSDIQSAKMSATAQCELVHDGRQYSIKTELASTTRGNQQQQFRHQFEAGVQRGSQSQSGRVASTYKPYLSIESSSLKRPIQMQGVVSYQQSPKTVISYELKCPTSGDFVQGKVILDERSNSANSNQYKRSTQRGRRSMQSPIELLLNKDLTLTSEFLGQVEQNAFKVHNMIDWDSDKFAVQSDLQASHKNLNNRNKQQQESSISASLKLDQDQQMMTIQRKCPQQERKEFRVTIDSDCRTPNQHQFVAECRYNGKRQSNLQSIVAYKHKVDLTSMSPKKIELGYTIEVQASECQLSEKLTGRTQVGLERNLKTIETEISAHGKSAKLDVEYVSLEQHKLEVVLQGERLQHRTSVRQDERQCSVQSRTEKDGQMIGKIVVEISKQQGEGQLIVELPTENTHVAADLKLGSNKLSSVAIKSPRFASKAEFSFEKMSRSAQKQGSQYLPAIWKKTFGQVEQFRFKTDLKDMMNKEAYWMESAWNKSPESKSYLRLDSPVYRTDVEFEPRDQSTKIGLFARSKRSVNQLNKVYSNEESLLSSALESAKLQLGGNKMWMIRSIISSPSELKQQARRALFEYADRRQSQKHSVNWSPAEERVNFQFERQPNSEYQTSNTGYSWSPMRFAGDLSRRQPSSLSMESEWIDFDVDAKPFGSEERYAKVSALSRHPRSAFKKHESEIRYQKKHGYSASMKHEDSQNKRHSMQLEADESPKKWAKMSFDSDKHGKAEYEHQWRKHVAKRNSHQNQQQQEQEEVYQNKVHFQRQSPNTNDWTHRSTLQWEEPTRFYQQQQQNNGRVRRDITGQDMSIEQEQQRRYNTIDYLKHVNARLQSQTSRNSADLYNVEFDYQPQHQQSLARLSVQMPEDLLHQSSLEFEPTERAYKLQSKLVNRRTNEPSYELLASSKLATSEQEPMFLNQQHPMLERPTGQSGRYYSTMTGLFKQPLKLDYTDKFGRIARVEYDQSPMSQADNKYQGLRQKRAALYYKDDSMDFEHQSSYDFYPETLFGGLKPTKRVPGDLTIKAHTKYGPVVLHADSTDKTVEMQLESPIVNAKITGETSGRQSGNKLVRVQIDNKRQTVQLAKIVRQHQILRDIPIIEELAQQLDQSRFEHQTDLLVNLVDSIYKIKSSTMNKQSPVMVIEGELNESSDKAYVKINGKRTNGQLAVDLVTGSAQLNLDVDNKRTIQHQTRLVRLSDKFYSIESMTSHKQQPLFKLNGKLEAKIFSEPEHLFAAHHSRQQQQKSEEHISTFEAVVYEPKPMQITGQFDCNKNEVRVNLKDMQSKKVSDVRVQYDEQTEKVLVEARQSNQRGTIVSSMQKTFNVAPLVEAY